MNFVIIGYKYIYHNEMSDGISIRGGENGGQCHILFANEYVKNPVFVFGKVNGSMQCTLAHAADTYLPKVDSSLNDKAQTEIRSKHGSFNLPSYHLELKRVNSLLLTFIMEDASSVWRSIKALV